MSFYPIQSTYHTKDDLHTHDDLDCLQEEEDSPTSTPPASSSALSSPVACPPSAQARSEHKEASFSPSPAPSSYFNFRPAPLPVSHHHRPSSSSVCSLPASPVDASSEHAPHAGRHRHKGGGQERRRPSADPATLFLLHRIMKGDRFTLYTVQPSSSPSSPPTVLASPVFLFFNAHHGRLGSLYWTSVVKAAHHAPRLGYDADESALVDSYERTQSASQCLPIHALTLVQHGRTAQLSEALVTSLPSACFLALHSSRGVPPLLLSHPHAQVLQQWLACLRGIFVQHEVEVRQVEGQEKLLDGSDDASHNHLSGLKPGGVGSVGGAAELMSAFVDPSEGVEALSLSSDHAQRMTLSEGQLGERQRSSLSLSEHGRAEEAGLMSRKAGARDGAAAHSMATCGTCVIA